MTDIQSQIAKVAGVVLLLCAGALGQSVTAQTIYLPLSSTPQPPNVAGAPSVVGQPGSSTYYFWLASEFTVGNSSLSGPFPCFNAPQTLTSGNYCFISWNKVLGANSYDLLMTTTPSQPSGACNCAVLTATSTSSANVQSNSLSSYTVTTLNPGSLLATIDNEPTGAGASAIIFRVNGIQQNLGGGLADPGANGLLKRTALNVTAVAGLSDLPAGIGLTANPLSQFASTTSAQFFGTLTNPTGTGLAVFNNGPTFVSLLDSALTPGNCLQAGTLGLLTTTSNPCGSSSGLPAAIIYVTPGSSQSAIQTFLNSATSGSQLLFSGTYAACGLTLTVANVRLTGLSEGGAVFQCATASSPDLTVSGSGLSAPQIENLTFQHITNSPTCAGGALSSTCGDGLQILGGASRAKIENVHANFNYHNYDLGWTTYSEIDRSVAEFGNGDGFHFVPDATHKTLQWEVRGTLSEQNLGSGYDATCPAAFTSVQGTSPHFSGWAQAFGNEQYGFHISCSAATTSGLADFWASGIFASQNNNSGIYLDLGSNGGRNAIISGVYSEQAGTFTGTAGFAQATQTATNVGDGITITSACDPSVAPSITGGNLWANSYSGATIACPETAVANVSTRGNGVAAASAQTEAGFTTNATNISIWGGDQDSGGSEAEAYYILGGDTPSIGGFTTDFATPIVVGTQPPNGFLDFQGNIGTYKNTGLPASGLCTSARNGWQYLRTDSGNFSTAYGCKNGAWVAEN